MAEFPGLGQHCGHSFCKQLDFLPMKCDACQKVFCRDHITYDSHQCASSYKKDVQVPVCPMCNKPVPVNRAAGELADEAVGRHMDRDCQSESSKKIYRNRCSLETCRRKELVPVVCSTCEQNFCLQHRHTSDHDCKGPSSRGKSKAGAAALARLQQQQTKPKPAQAAAVNSRVVPTPAQGAMSEDEQLALAMQMSLNDNIQNKPTKALTQEEQDRMLAESLQRNEYETQPARPSTRGRSNRDKCTVA